MVNIIGNGQIAKLFKENKVIDDAFIFASGVSDSNCTDENLFDKEKKLLCKGLKDAKELEKTFVYFSSCALTPKGYNLNRYYQHKREMENLILDYTNNYLILRLPQLFGSIKIHSTLINFLYYRIIERKEFYIYKDAYRYVIYLNDLYKIVNELFNHGIKKKTLDIANPYRYKVMDIVQTMESLLNIKAVYRVTERSDGYCLDFMQMKSIINMSNINIEFGKNYLEKNLKHIINEKLL